MSNQRPPSAIARPSAPTTAPATQQADGQRPPQTIRELTNDIVYDKIGETLVRILPRDITADQYQASLVSLLMQNPELVGCELPALAVAVFNAARCGLDVNPMLGHVYLTPQKVRQKKLDARGRPVLDGGGREVWAERKLVRMMVGYKGLIFLGRRSGLTPLCEARVVYEGDKFDWNEGIPPTLSHRPTLKTKERGEIYASYARAKLHDGTYVFRVIDMDDVERAMRASGSAFETKWDEAARKKVPTGKINPNSPWGTDYAAMVMKTAVRRFYKGFDLGDPSARVMAAALHADDAYTAGKIPVPTNVFTGEQIEAPAKMGGAADWGDAEFGQGFSSDSDFDQSIDVEAHDGAQGDTRDGDGNPS